MLPDYAACAVQKLENLNVSQYKYTQVIYTAHRLNLQYAPTADRQPDTVLSKLLQILAVCSIIGHIQKDSSSVPHIKPKPGKRCNFFPLRGIYRKNALPDPFFGDKWGTERKFFRICP